MKLPIERIIICILIFVITIMIMKNCARPSERREADRKKLYETEIAILKADKAEIQSRQEATVKAYNVKLKEDSSNLALQDSRIQALKSKLASQRPKVIEKIQADTAVLSYVNTLEEIVTELTVQIDTLKAQKEFHRMVNQDLIAQEFVEDKVEQQLAIEQTQRIEELDKAAKKRERKSRFVKILVPVAAVAGFLLGSQL